MKYYVQDVFGRYLTAEGCWTIAIEGAAEFDREDLLDVDMDDDGISIETYFECEGLHGQEIEWGYRDGTVMARAYEVRS